MLASLLISPSAPPAPVLSLDMLTATFVLLSLFTVASHGKFLTNVTELSENGYDFVIVGGMATSPSANDALTNFMCSGYGGQRTRE